jgi:hypothetical protein
VKLPKISCIIQNNIPLHLVVANAFSIARCVSVPKSEPVLAQCYACCFIFMHVFEHILYALSELVLFFYRSNLFEKSA